MNSGMSVKWTNNAPSRALICVKHAYRETIIYSRAYSRHILAFRGRGLKLVNYNLLTTFKIQCNIQVVSGKKNDTQLTT